VEVSVPGTRLRERGSVLITHEGLSGPPVLRLSAWGARALHGFNYNFPLHVNWVPELGAEGVLKGLTAERDQHPSQRVMRFRKWVPARLWESLVRLSGIDGDPRWAECSRRAFQQLTRQLTRMEVMATGKSLNKDEFVTCGGVPLGEVDFKTLGSRICRGLHFAGEILDIDGVTGGFNFQAAWTTGWIAGRALAGACDG
jgi:predicted Rossmann fold flavoprotein